MSDETQQHDPADQLSEELDERLRSVKNPAERRTITNLLREIGTLPLDHTRAALETSAARIKTSWATYVTTGGCLETNRASIGKRRAL